MTAFFYYCFYFIIFFCWLQTRRCYRTLWLTPPSYPRPSCWKKKDMSRALGSERKERKQKEEGPGLATTGPPRKQPLLCLSPPRLTMGAEESVYGSSWAHYSTHVSDCCDSGQNKTHTFSKREQKSFSAYHKRPALMLPVCTAVSTLCHTGHPCCVNVGNDYGKMRLYTPIRSKTTALPRCARQPQCAARTLKSSAPEVMNLLEKGAIEIVPPAQSESGLYTRYFLVPKKEGVLWPILDLRLLNYTLMKRSFRMITLKQILPQICPGDWFMSLDLKEGLASWTPPRNGVSGLCTSPGPLEGPLLATYITRAASSRSDSACWRTTYLCGLRTICAHWRRRMYRAKWTKEQTCCQGTMSLQRNGCSTCSRFREFGKSLAVLE